MVSWALTKKLHIELTKSRVRQSNDNALVESKNGSIVRKHLGYSHIRQRWTPRVHPFHRDYLNPYINDHQSCFFPITRIDVKGKHRKIYPYAAMMTAYEKFLSLPKPSQYLKQGITLKQLHAIALAITDNEAAKRLKEAKKQLFKTIAGQDNQVA